MVGLKRVSPKHLLDVQTWTNYLITTEIIKHLSISGYIVKTTLVISSLMKYLTKIFSVMFTIDMVMEYNLAIKKLGVIIKKASGN